MNKKLYLLSDGQAQQLTTIAQQHTSLAKEFLHANPERRQEIFSQIEGLREQREKILNN